MTKTFSSNDTLLVIGSTVAIGLLLIAVSSLGHTESLLVGLGALISVLLVRVRSLRREMAALKHQLREKQSNEEAQPA